MKTNDFVTGAQSGSVVHSVEDRPQRFFHQWYPSIVQEKKSTIEDLTDDNCKDVVHELAMNLLEIGKGLQSESSEEVDLSR